MENEELKVKNEESTNEFFIFLFSFLIFTPLKHGAG